MIILKEGGLDDHDDNNVGIDDSHIRYPGVSSCVTITCVLGNTRLVGAHMACMWSDGKINSGLNRMRELSGDSPILSVFLVGMFAKWILPFNRMKPGNFATEVRAILGPTLPVWIYDATALKGITVDAERVGAGTHAAFIDLTWSTGNRFLRPTDFTMG